ncbi:MAG: hypothetical protein EWM72_03477 [Nitrospira sp.]|nr:MAG: hypothetical protein EWM72_03477 [Nitrospira sp.]
MGVYGHCLAIWSWPAITMRPVRSASTIAVHPNVNATNRPLIPIQGEKLGAAKTVVRDGVLMVPSNSIQHHTGWCASQVMTTSRVQLVDFANKDENRSIEL